MSTSTLDTTFPVDTIFHFSYHKCLTVYYEKILRDLGREFSFEYHHSNGDLDDFISRAKQKGSRSILSVNNNSDIPFELFDNYRGSHFIRDPRDLLVSGYRYHLWTHEEWCNAPGFDWSWIVDHPIYKEYISNDPSDFPKNISYKDYLNTLTKEQGIIVELIWRGAHFREMMKWDFGNKNIIEKRYEDIVGREIIAFEEIFSHYGFLPDVISRALKIVDRHSIKNQKKSATSHVRSGATNQWKKEFSPRHIELFNSMYPNLVSKLGYDLDW